jgi:diketogulonate reductase-like aldo/keto reductase
MIAIGCPAALATALWRLVAREDVFVTTKLWNSDHGYDEALRAYDASHRRLGLDQADLFLLHWPVPHRRRHSWCALGPAVKALGFPFNTSRA